LPLLAWPEGTKLATEEQTWVDKIAQRTPPARDLLASLIGSLQIYRADRGESISPRLRSQIDRLPSRLYVLRKMPQDELPLLEKGLRALWKQAVGKDWPQEKAWSGEHLPHLDGDFWLLPGEILIGGFNHFSAAKQNKQMVCALLGINPFLFEQKLHAQDPLETVRLVLEHGGIRFFVDSRKSAVICQCNEESFPMAQRKMRRLVHRRKVVKVLDPTAPYRGWKSGVPIHVEDAFGKLYPNDFSGERLRFSPHATV
jgi:hypothetical protein